MEFVYNPFTNNLDAIGSGGGGSGIATIDGDSGSVTGSTVTIFANQAVLNSGSSVNFVNSGTTSTLNVTDGGLNTIIGLDAGVLSNTASQCTGLGYQCLASITDDDSHVAIGRGALQSTTDATSNTAIGAYALNAVVSGGDNTAVGAHAGISLTTGSFNTILGYFAGTSYTGSESSNILIGHAGVASENNVIRIGTQGSSNLEQNVCYVAGVAGVSVSNTNMVTIDTTTGQLGSQAVPSPGGISTYFYATLSTTQNAVTGDGTDYALIADNVVKNVGSGYNGTTGIFTAPSDGLYQFNITIFLNGFSGNTQIYIYLLATSSDQVVLVNENAANVPVAGAFVISTSVSVYLTTGETAQPHIDVVGAGSPNINVLGTSPDGEFTIFSGFLIGP